MMHVSIEHSACNTKGFPGGSVQETQVGSLAQEDPLEEEMTTHSGILAWKTSWTRTLAGYSPWGGKRVGQD